MAIWILAALAVAVAGAVFVLRSKRLDGAGITRAPMATSLVADAPEPPAGTEVLVAERPSRLVFGNDPDHPIVAVEMSTELVRYQQALPVDLKDSGISRLSAALQAAPSLLVAGEAAGKRLMEVVVNGNLAQAADGNGLRGFALGATGIKEHARFFEVEKLQTMINAAAVWQVASVIVAQKHLADISAKLSELSDAVKGVSEFLVLERRSVITGTLDFLHTAATAVHGGELSQSVRQQLEACDLQLTQVLHHLCAEYQSEAARLPSDTDTIGSAGITDALKAKMSKLQATGGDIGLCLRTRIAAWHVLALYPGEQQLKLARRDAIQRSVEEVRALPGYLDQVLDRDLGTIKAFWNSADTLQKRKVEVRASAGLAIQGVRSSADEGYAMADKTVQLLIKHAQPTRYFFEIDGFEVIGVRREALPMAA